MLPLQLQALLGEGHVNIVAARQVLLTCKHVALVMDLAAGGSMADHVSKKWQQLPSDKLFMSEDETRYYSGYAGAHMRLLYMAFIL